MFSHVVAQAIDIGTQSYEECRCESRTTTTNDGCIHELLHACALGLGITRQLGLCLVICLLWELVSWTFGIEAIWRLLLGKGVPKVAHIARTVEGLPVKRDIVPQFRYH